MLPKAMATWHDGKPATAGARVRRANNRQPPWISSPTGFVVLSGPITHGVYCLESFRHPFIMFLLLNFSSVTDYNKHRPVFMADHRKIGTVV
ncbi:hypothetical protein ElyMa_006014500 [Elysia marginata]|uniref:Uncharacterized protein n=1 Tax=Elysia marginata TaxID=1093978 RepID=A0AAV4GHE9_9GAST|nr:hypothetical protein ElyMa_006014500 [Elysia marginata]